MTDGYYTLDGDVLTMTDRRGSPVRNISSGEKYVHTLKPGQDPYQVASLLTLKIRHMLHGDTVSGFNRPLNYPSSSVV